jgi:hypothetical protein
MGMPLVVFGSCIQMFTVTFALDAMTAVVVNSTFPPSSARKVGA